MPRGRFGRAVIPVPTRARALAFGLVGGVVVSAGLAGTAVASTTTGQPAGAGGVELAVAGVGVALGAAWLLKPAGWRLHRRGRGSRGMRHRFR